MSDYIVSPHKGECPEKNKHTECPKGYMAFFEWAEEMKKTHKQMKCKSCGTYSIWVKK